MALKTTEKAEAPLSSTANTTVLELALYTIYTWQGVTYHHGKPYRFRNADAMVLLAEQDLGRQVWRLYRPPAQPQTPKNEIVDATMIEAPPPYEDLSLLGPGGVVNKSRQRIEVGTDDEIQDILNRDGGDVTV